MSILGGNMLVFAGLAALVAGNLKFSGRKLPWTGFALAVGVPFALFTILYDRPEHFQETRAK